MRRILFLLAIGLPAVADTQFRVPVHIDESVVTKLSGNVPPQVAQLRPEGRVPSSFPLPDMTISFRKTEAQQKALDQFLKDQQDPNMPHEPPLTPEQFADRFGLSRTDVDRIVLWLRLRGFRVGTVSRGRDWIMFRGNAKQVKRSFHVEIMRYRWENKLHYSNSEEPSVPAAIADVVSGIRGLDDFDPKPLIQQNRAPVKAGSRNPLPFTAGPNR